MRGHIRKRGGRSWEIILYLGRDAAGKKQYKHHTMQGGRRDAERERTRLLHELETGVYVEPTKLTVAGYLERWLGDYASRKVGAKTYERYAEIVRNQLTPALGCVALRKLQPLHIQECYSWLLRQGRRDGNGGLSARTVLHCHRLLRTALQQAVKWQLVPRNAADAAEPPTPERKEMQALDEAHTVWLFEAARGTRLYGPILFTATTGVRRGEVLGVQWADMDLDCGTVSIRRSVQQTRQGGVVFKVPKNNKPRVIDMPALLVEALREHRADQQRSQALQGDAWEDRGLVFPREDGSIWKPEQFSDAYFAFTRKIGVRVRFHDLRHSHASQLLRQGVPVKVVSERLGHSDVTITLNLYAHVLPGMQKEAAQKIDSALRKAMHEQNLPVV